MRDPEHAHVPETHVVPVPQALLQLPQWAASAIKFTHWPPQSVVPVGQTHCPDWQA